MLIKKNNNRKHRKSDWIIMITMWTIAAGLLVYPAFADSISDIRQTVVIGGYAAHVDSLSEEEIFSLRQQAFDYNRQLWELRQYEPFRYQGEDYDDSWYDSTLKGDPFSSVMAYIEIPLTGAFIPIVHGTRTEDLAYQAGHMYGTSLPVGGSETHAVIGAHTGQKNADLFNGLDRIEAGEQVYMHVLGEVHIYTVREKTVVLPSDADFYLQIEEGRDLLTLYTCTPYGINSHRLLVTCERSGTAQPQAVGGVLYNEKKNIQAVIRAVALGLIPAVVAFSGICLYMKKRKRQKIE